MYYYNLRMELGLEVPEVYKNAIEDMKAAEVKI